MKKIYLKGKEMHQFYDKFPTPLALRTAPRKPTENLLLIETGMARNPFFGTDPRIRIYEYSWKNKSLN